LKAGLVNLQAYINYGINVYCTNIFIIKVIYFSRQFFSITELIIGAYVLYKLYGVNIAIIEPLKSAFIITTLPYRFLL